MKFSPKKYLSNIITLSKLYKVYLEPNKYIYNFFFFCGCDTSANNVHMKVILLYPSITHVRCQ